MNRKTVQKNSKSKTLAALIIELDRAMQTDLLFVDPLLNRSRLAKRLYTNENYLHECILLYKGVTVGHYINTLRLEHACKLLTHPTEEYTIESIALNAGFGSRSTFHNIFRRHYRITPDEYRRRQGAGARFPCGTEGEPAEGLT